MARPTGSRNRPKTEQKGEMALPAQSTLAVDKDIADAVRAVAKDNGVTTLEVTNQMLKYCLKLDSFALERTTFVINPKRSGRL